MNKTQFTKGPWVVGDMVHTNKSRSLGVWPDPPERNPICLITEKGNETELDVANARLISHAPEMYELLEQIIRWPGNSVPKESIKELLDRITPPVSDNTQTQNKGG